VQEDRFSRHPEDLSAMVQALPNQVTHIVLDEIQKIPKLLDVVHQLIESEHRYFVMSGSSARKLKAGGANLLAGRAFVYHLHAFSIFELPQDYDWQQVMRWGLLPKVTQCQDDAEKRQFLQSYALTYLKEEIWSEQFIRKLDPFRRFLEVSAQCNGKIVNFSRIARDVDVDHKTIAQYFSLLEDTLIGFFLAPFHHSFRKRLSGRPKFYYFDIGVTRALARILSVPPRAGTSYYGEVFEHFVLLECVKMAQYFQSEYRFYYLRTKDDAEIDLIVERPGLPLLAIEIKSASSVSRQDLRRFEAIASELDDCEAICLCNETYAKRYDQLLVLPWREGILQLFGARDEPIPSD
jgi:predicted AAA+ superfamily ATPase